MPHVQLAALLLLSGGIAFHYAPSLTPRELEWYSRFDVLVTHDPLPAAQIEALHRRGTRLVLYEWATAWYASRATPWHAALPAAAILNPHPLRGHLGATDIDAFYYDPAAREHQRGRAEMLAERIRALHYDGIFFDATTSDSVHPEALAIYRQRHPELPYDEAFARFLDNLRRELGDGIIVTNQGYRHADDVLPYVDWDVTESLITHPRDGRFVLRPWNDPKNPWNSIDYLMRHLIAPARQKYPRVQFAHINYVDRIDRARIAEIVAITRIFGAAPVVSLRDAGATVEDDLLLLDLGGPLSHNGGRYRFFENGFVAYNPSPRALRISNETAYEDVLTGRRVRGTIVVPPRSARILRRLR